jgi:hypothetical protein
VAEALWVPKTRSASLTKFYLQSFLPKSDACVHHSPFFSPSSPSELLCSPFHHIGSSNCCSLLVICYILLSFRVVKALGTALILLNWVLSFLLPESFLGEFLGFSPTWILLLPVGILNSFFFSNFFWVGL